MLVMVMMIDDDNDLKGRHPWIIFSIKQGGQPMPDREDWEDSPEEGFVCDGDDEDDDDDGDEDDDDGDDLDDDPLTSELRALEAWDRR